MVECFCPPLEWSVAERKRRAKTADRGRELLRQELLCAFPSKSSHPLAVAPFLVVFEFPVKIL